MPAVKVIQIHLRTDERLRKRGAMGKTYDNVINDILDIADKCDELHTFKKEAI